MPVACRMSACPCMLLHVVACHCMSFHSALCNLKHSLYNGVPHTLFPMVSFAPDDTAEGCLPPWEMAKAFAFYTVLQKAAELLTSTPSDLVGERVDDYIAKQLTLKGGGQPSSRSVRKAIARCQEPSWYPGKPSDQTILIRAEP